MHIGDLVAAFTPKLVIGTGTLAGMVAAQQASNRALQQHQPADTPAFTSVNGVLANSHIVFTPMSVVLATLEGMALYTITTQEMDDEDLKAFATRDDGYFKNLFAKRIMLGAMTTQARIAALSGGFTGRSIYDGLKTAMDHTGDMDLSSIPLHYYKHAMFGLFDSDRDTDPSRPVKATMLPDRVVFSYGNVTVAALPTDSMTHDQVQRFIRGDASYFQNAFTQSLEQLAKTASAEALPSDPAELASWLDMHVPDWDDTAPDVLFEVLEDYLEINKLDDATCSKIIAMGSIRNSDTYTWDPVVFEKVLVAFGDNPVDYAVPQFLDNIVELCTAFSVLRRYIHGRKIRLSSRCVQYLGDLLFDFGCAICPFPMIVDNADDVNDYLASIWEPAVPDARAVQAWCMETIAREVPPSRTLSDEGKELAKSTLAALRAGLGGGA